MRATVRARGKHERRLLGEVRGEQLRRVVDDDDGRLRCHGRAAPDLPVHDDLAPARQPIVRRLLPAPARGTLRLPMSETHVREAAVAESDAGGAPELSVVVTLFQEGATLEELHRRADDDARGVRPVVRGRSTSTTARRTGRSRRSSGSTTATRTSAPCASSATVGQHPAMHAGLVPRARADRRDDGRRSAEPARGHSAARRGGRGGLRRRERPPRRAPRLVGPDAAVAADQRHAAPLHGRRHLGLRLRVQRLPARRRRADARRDRPAEVHEGARALGRRDRRRGRRRPRAPAGRVALLAASAHAPRAPRARRLLAAADPDGRRSSSARSARSRRSRSASTGSSTGSRTRTSPARCCSARPSSSCSACRASSSPSSASTSAESSATSRTGPCTSSTREL